MFTLHRNTNCLLTSAYLRTTSTRVIGIVVALSFLCGTVSQTMAQQLGKPNRLEQRLTFVQDRRTLAYSNMFPFSAVVKIRVTFSGNRVGWGTGAMIGPDKVLTAEHVVYDKSRNEHAETIEVLPGYSGNYVSCNKTRVKSFRHGSHQGCHDGANCDMAVLTTMESLGCDVGWFGYKQFSDGDVSNVYIAGYPEDLNDGETMYYVNSSASHIHNSYGLHNILSYRDWTSEGMSGGPIFTSDYYIVGIHTEGSSEANYGVALCNQLIATIREWSYQ